LSGKDEGLDEYDMNSYNIIENTGFLFREPGSLYGKASETLRSLPAIRRARDFRLYTEDGRRLTDLWQYGGHAILGHTPPAVLRELKNAASRGLFAPFPSCYEGRLIKALSRLFPGRIVRLYAGETSLRLALARAGYDASAPFRDPAFPASGAVAPPFPPGKSPPVLWRPFLEDPLPTKPAAGPRPRGGYEIAADERITGNRQDRAGQETAGNGRQPPEILVPLLPLPWAGVPRPLVIDKSLEAAFPPAGQDLLSPLVLAAAARSVYDLALQEQRSRKFPRVWKALTRSSWHRRGVYLTQEPAPGEEAYAALFRRFLEKGFLLPPDPYSPLILPGELSPGEETALASLISG
jgi:hypothetical protein